MKTELWGTFSVKDHMRRRPFVAEVLLYDRLIIPRPPTREEEPPVPGEEDEIQRWRQNGWGPARLHKLLDILKEGNLAVELPWNKQARENWDHLYHGSLPEKIGAERSAFVQLAANEIERAKNFAPNWAPYVATGGLLAASVANAVQIETFERIIALARTPGVPIEPVIAYSSFGKYKKEQSVQQADSHAMPENIMPYAMFGWEFFVPEDIDKSNEELLRNAVKLAVRPDFREIRQSFHGWLKQLHEGHVDPETTKAEMVRLLEEYRAIVRKSRVKTGVRYVAKVTTIAAPLTGLALGPVFGTFAGVGARGAELIVELLIPNKGTDELIRPAALVYNARQFFGKKYRQAVSV